LRQKKQQGDGNSRAGRERIQAWG